MAYISAEGTKVIRNKLKEAFPKFKFSVRNEHHSSIGVVIRSGPVRFVEADSGAINHYHLHHYEHEDVLRAMLAIINEKNWDRSDSQYDHFDVGFYVSVHQGTWDRPYILTEGGRDAIVLPEPAKEEEAA